MFCWMDSGHPVFSGGHKKKLPVGVAPWPHDHNPLNGARNACYLFNGTLKKARPCGEPASDASAQHQKKIEVLAYDDEWPSVFQKEHPRLKEY